MIERSGESNGVPLRGLCGKTELITFQGEIALGLLPRMGKDQVLDGEISVWLLISELDRYQSLVCLCGFLDPALHFLSV